MQRLIAIIFLVSINLAFVACKKKAKSGSAAYTPTCNGTKSFSTDVFPLIQSRCWSCHTNMSNYGQIKALESAIRINIVNGSMPKNGTLTNAERDIIVCWVDAGAPNN